MQLINDFLGKEIHYNLSEQVYHMGSTKKMESMIWTYFTWVEQEMHVGLFPCLKKRYTTKINSWVIGLWA